MGGAEHLPVAGHGLEDVDRDGFLLVVAELDLPLDLVDAAADLLPVALDALAAYRALLDG